MSTLRAGKASRVFVLGTLVALATWEVGALAVGPDNTPPSEQTGAQQVAQANTDKAPAQPEKTIDRTVIFEMRGKEWGKVLEWLVDQSGVPFTGVDKPGGTFTFIAPRNAKDKYTIPEVVDILNEALKTQKFLIIRLDQSYTCIPSDQPIDPSVLPRILPQDMDKHGNSELVSVVLKLKAMVAEDAAKEVREMMGPFGKVVTMPASNSLLLQDTVGNLRRIRATIQDSEDGEKNDNDTFKYNCVNIDAADAERMLKALLPNPPEPQPQRQQMQPQFGFPQFGQQVQPQPAAAPLTPNNRLLNITVDDRLNSVLLTGPANKIAMARKILKEIDVPFGEQAPGASGRIIKLPSGGSGAAVAEELQRILKEMYPQNPVKVITPGSEQKKPEPVTPKAAPPRGDGKDKSARADEEGPTYYVSQQLVDPQQKPAPQTEAKGAPITITAVGNKLLITCEDPKMVSLLNDMVRVMTQANTSNDGPFEVIRLKNASAVDTAKILDEAYNGNKPQQNQQQRGQFAFQFPGMTQAPAPAATTQRIRVVADAGSNALLIKASTLDMLEIRKMLRDHIDSGESDSKAIMKSHVIGPLKNARATEVAETIRDVYREHLNQNPNLQGGFVGFGGGFGGGRFRGGQQNLNVDANGNPRAVSLSIGINDQTNSLIVNCSDALFKDIDTLVKQLETAAGNATRTVRIIPLKGIDPTLVQTAIDAIQGRRSNFRSGSGFGGPGMGGFGGGGFPGGGGFGGFGGGRGGFGGGGFPGGGFGGGGGRPPGGGGPQASLDGPKRGPDFFAQRVMDDPQPSVLFDPQHSANDGQQLATYKSLDQNNGAFEGSGIQPTGLDEEQQQPATTPPAPGAIRGPRSPVNAEALPELGGIIISGNNQEDVELVLQIIRLIQEQLPSAEIQVDLVPLTHADATSVTATLAQLFGFVNFTPTGNVRSTTRPQATPTLGIQGAPGAPGTTTLTTPQQQGQVILIPLPRFNSILVAAPKSRLADVTREIKRLDQPSTVQGKATPFPLKRASAAQVETFINNWYGQRYPQEGATQHQIRITHHDASNTVFVQAAPADMKEIRDLIEWLDTNPSIAVNDVRVIFLKTALSDELAQLLSQAVSAGLATPTPSTGVVPTTPGAPGAPGAPRTTGLPGAPGVPGGPTTPTTPTTTPTTLQSTTTSSQTTKTTTLRFYSTKGVSESGLLEDIHITSDPRINALILAAPTKTMSLLLRLIEDLDVPPKVRATIKVFQIHRADAGVMASIIQQIFLGTTGTTTGVGAGAGAAGGAAVTPEPTMAAPGIPRAQFTLGVTTPEGAPLVPLSVTPDARTNSIIVAGNANDVDVIEILVDRLDNAEIRERQHRVIHLRNASAPDVANALQGFLTNSLAVLGRASQLPPFLEMERDVVIVPEPFTNKLLISAAPAYFTKILQLVEELDMQPPQVVIQVLIAEVDLNASEEFGVELGLQSPVLFQRSIQPSGGVVINNTSNLGRPGFPFNDVTQALPNSSLISPGIVGFQGLGNLGTGRVSPANSSIGGFVFSASSDAFTLLVRALKTQGRLDVLSRPQLTTLDNQTATLNVGQNIPIISTSNVTSTGVISNSFDRLSVGVNLSVTPRINPDGTVLMRVTPEVSSVISTMVQLGGGSFGTSYNDQKVDTTVLVGDGETIAIGGLIQKRDQKNENKVPWFGDLPYVGALFRFRTQEKTKTELLVILTPHIIRSRLDADRILGEEARRMDWIIGDVIKTHGTTGLEPILPPLPSGTDTLRQQTPPGTCPLPPAPLLGEPLPSIEIVPEPVQRELLPPPRKNPDTPPRAQPKPVDPKSSSAGPYVPGIPNGASSPPALTRLGEEPVPATTTEAPKEKEKSRLWKILHPGQ